MSCVWGHLQCNVLHGWRDVFYCLPGGVQHKDKVGWAEVSKLIWYRTVPPPLDIHRIISCQLWWFWLKWRHYVNHSHSHQKYLIRFLASSRSYFLTRNLKISAFDHDLQVVQESWRGWTCVPKYGPHRHMFTICPFMEFSCRLVLIKLSAWFPVMSIQLSH